MQSPLRVINCAEVDSSDWRFLEGQVEAPPQQWRHIVGMPANALERAVTRPNIARLRSCAHSALAARTWRADIVITHLPRVTAWYGLFAPQRESGPRHLAFSFNFTTLPGPALTALMRRAYRSVDRFVVYSTAERTVYARAFGIDPGRVDVLPWAMEVPQCEANWRVTTGDYVCSVGGEARDFVSLIKVAQRMPDVTFVVVTRPYAIDGLTFPDNVQVHTNLPPTRFWSVVQGARAVLLPLRDSETNCGHISLVGCMQVGTAIVTTRSSGTGDYVTHGDNALIGEPQDVDALVRHTRQLLDDPTTAERMIARGRQFVERNCTPDRWTRYWARYLEGTQPRTSFIDNEHSDPVPASDATPADRAQRNMPSASPC